jgi:DNA-binding transcriptional MocR family regulator
MFLWVELPSPRASRLAAHALDVGLRLTPGPRFMIDGTADRWLRLPFTGPAEQMDTVAGLLREAAGRAAGGDRPNSTPSRWTA